MKSKMTLSVWKAGGGKIEVGAPVLIRVGSIEYEGKILKYLGDGFYIVEFPFLGQPIERVFQENKIIIEFWIKTATK